MTSIKKPLRIRIGRFENMKAVVERITDMLSDLFFLFKRLFLFINAVLFFDTADNDL